MLDSSFCQVERLAGIAASARQVQQPLRDFLTAERLLANDPKALSRRGGVWRVRRGVQLPRCQLGIAGNNVERQLFDGQNQPIPIT